MSTQWPRVPIVALCSEHADCVNRTAPVVPEQTPFKMIRTTNVRNGFIDVDSVRYVEEDVFKRWTRRLLPKRGDVVLTREAPLGDVGMVRTDDSNFLGQRLYHFRPDPRRLNAHFLLYSLLGPDLQGQIKACGSGATVEHMRLQDVQSLEILLPSLVEQCRIGETLAAYDDLVENNRRRIQILEQMARAFYREWFVEFRFPSHERVQRVSSPLGPIPASWKVVSVDEVCERVTDGSHYSPRSVGDGLPMASSKDMHEWGLNRDTCRQISRKDFDLLVRNGCKAQKNDVLITKDGNSYLKHIFVMPENEEVVLLSSIAILRPNARINPHLLAATLRAPENKSRLKNFVTGAAIPRVILKDFKRFQITLPTLDVQERWALIAEPNAELCWTLIDQNRSLRRTRDLLLPRLLSGQITLTEAAA